MSATTGTGFADFVATRTGLLRRADQLEAIWRRCQAGRTAHEELVGAPPAGDTVTASLDEARHRLETATVEVGVFGEVNRGKSTLLNALIGEEVSSMRVTPETARLVWVLRGSGPAEVVYADGRVELIEDRQAAMDMASQRRRRGKGDADVIRVVQHVDSDWLPAGVRLIDTPGLSDPVFHELYDELSLAELDRVSTAIFVFMSPPGVLSREAELLRSLGERRVDKAFLVCNFHRDQWESPEDRNAVEAYIRDQILAGAAESGGLDADDVRLYSVNARQGWAAAGARDHDGYEASGVADLRRDLEAFLSQGVLRRLERVTRTHLEEAEGEIRRALRERIELLSTPERIERLRAERQATVDEARGEIDRVAQEIRREVPRLEAVLRPLAAQAFEEGLRELQTLHRKNELAAFEARMRIRLETMGSRLTRTYLDELGTLEDKVRLRLFQAFRRELPNDADRAQLRRIDGLETLSLSASGRMTGEGVARIATGAVGAGVVAGLVGGSLAGGFGIALVALGPVGWIIGAGIGLGLGALVGGTAAGLIVTGGLSTEDRRELAQQLEAARNRATEKTATLCSRGIDDLVSALRQREGWFIRAELDELERVTALAADRAGRDLALRDATALLDELSGAPR